jgi:hypothetical protein
VPVAVQEPRESRQGRVALLVGMMFNPGAVLQRRLAGVTWPTAMLVSGAAFTLLFLQTGLDLLKSGRAGAGAALLLTFAGLLYGTIGILVVGFVAWALSRPFGPGHSPGWAIRAYALAYSPALVYGLCGMAANLALGWRTSVAFGVTGLLWALGPIMAVNDELTGGRKGVSVLLSIVCGGVALLGWSLLGRV